MYDVEGLDHVGIQVRGRWRDTMVNEAFLSERGSTSLDATAHRRLKATKDEALLTEAAAAYGVDPKGEMYLLPARYVGPYGERDAALLPGILSEQKKLFDAYALWDIYDLESRLLPLIWEMRKHGVGVDLEQAALLDQQWESILCEQIRILSKQIPFRVDIWSPKSLVKVCEYLRLEYNRTPKGNPSFENEWFEKHEHPLMQVIAVARKYSKMRRDFIQGQIFEYEINGRIHSQYHTTRSDDGGTRSGRFSSSNPNQQQVPERDPIFGKAIRSLYLPDSGGRWVKFDYSSQEPRITLHLAYVAGLDSAAPFVDRYRRDPAFCQHDFASNILGIGRKTCKGINLGLTYGMGIPKLALQLDTDVHAATVLRRDYKLAMPFVSEVADEYTEFAEKHGYIQTVLGRRSWFTGDDKDYCYKALNRAVQGSGADLMKKAMLDVYDEIGIVPLLTVHDEVDYTIYDEEVVPQIAEIMENAIPMSVPQYVEPEIGPNWGTLT